MRVVLFTGAKVIRICANYIRNDFFLPVCICERALVAHSLVDLRRSSYGIYVAPCGSSIYSAKIISECAINKQSPVKVRLNNFPACERWLRNLLFALYLISSDRCDI